MSAPETILFDGTGDLELRAGRRGGRRLRGRFPYRRRAVLSDGGRRGRPQKEEFEPGAFSFRIKDPAAEIHLLIGHDYSKPLASKLAGTLKFFDTLEALIFDADITPEVAATSYATDALALIEAGLAVGVSPGFRLPPERAVPKAEAERITEEPIRPSEGMFGATIRTILQALLFELSIVTAPAYDEAEVEARSRAVADPTKKIIQFHRRWRA